MTVRTVELYFEKPVEDLYILNITPNVEKSVSESHIRNGIATIFIGCSTASISTMKHEPHSVDEMHDILEKLAPSGIDYEHHKTCGDMFGLGGDINGKSHVRSALLGPSITLPFKDGRLMVDKDQDVVLMDFDLIKRKRKVIVQIMGE
ncbi:MAG: secondary thiamine-phosphate synthase enzyme YjbQ [Candidatus Micrarchaeaceae archaeon]